MLKRGKTTLNDDDNDDDDDDDASVYCFCRPLYFRLRRLYFLRPLVDCILSFEFDASSSWAQPNWSASEPLD